MKDCQFIYSLKIGYTKLYFRVMTTKGGRTGRERPRANRRALLTPVVVSVHQPSAEGSGAAVQQVQDTQGDGSSGANSVNIPVPPPLPPPIVITSSDQVQVESLQQSIAAPQAGPPPQASSRPAWPPGTPVCEALLRGDCPNGITGRTGGLCPSSHPKRCDKFLTWGSGGEKGCDGSSCGKYHIKVCPSS